MSELPCITVYFLPPVCIDCFLYLKTEMHSVFIQFAYWKCIHIAYSPVCFCVLVMCCSVQSHVSDVHIWTYFYFLFRCWFHCSRSSMKAVVHCTVAETRIQAHSFCVERYFFQHHWFMRLPVVQKALVFWWHGHGHCCWSISPSAALVHWAVCLFFCHSHGVIGHMTLQSHLESKLGQQNLCPVGCSVLSGALCYCGNL